MFDTIVTSTVNKTWIDYIQAIVPSIIGAISLWVAWRTLNFTKESLEQQKQQFIEKMDSDKQYYEEQIRIQKRQHEEDIKVLKEQWVNDEYIKREAFILLEFRDAFYNAKESILWFSQNLLNPYRVYVKMFPDQKIQVRQTDLIITKENYKAHYNKINKLNNLYNRNQMLFKKNGIEQEIAYICALLSTSIAFQDQDFIFEFAEETDKEIKYKMRDFDKIANLFVTPIYYNEDKTVSAFSYNWSDDDKYLEKYKSQMDESMIKLMFKLDEITTYYDGEIPDNLKMRSMQFFKDME